MAYTFLMLAEETLRQVKTPLSANEIWQKASELHYIDKLPKYGATPQATLGAQIYVEIKKNGESSKFIQVSRVNPKFYLRELKEHNIYATEEESASDSKQTLLKEKYKERDLHPLLTKYVYSAPHFKCYTKTIYHEKSQKSKKGKNKWLHPDIVGVYYPFDDYDDNTIAMIGALKENACKLFSFELKIEVDYATLREYYFQAVSNSSWANEGYLVALKYADESALVDEMRRLNNSFGIGFIELDAENIEQSRILFAAKAHKNVDWDTVNRLVEDNTDFMEFVKSVEEDIKVSKVKSAYDEVLEDGEYQSYITAKCIV